MIKCLYHIICTYVLKNHKHGNIMIHVYVNVMILMDQKHHYVNI